MDANETGMGLVDLIRDEMAPFNDVGRRIIANRVIDLVRVWEEKQKTPQTEPIVPMTEQEMTTFGHTTMKFGKHEGEKIKDVPLSYLVWLADESRQTWRKLHAYLNTPAVKARMETEESE